MKKLESFLRDYSWLLKLGIGVLAFFWATSLYVPLVGDMKKEIAYQKSRDIKKEMTQRVDLFAFVEKQAMMAEKMGSDYGPENYFADLKNKDELENKLHLTLGANPHSIKMQQLLHANMEAGFFKNSDLERARNKFKMDLQPSREELNSLKMENILDWATSLYGRGLVLVMLIYFIRMAQRKGILETILADKKRFLLAVIFWPVLIGKYPYNVVREIIVEAELRRLGDIFRKLSPKEKIKIQSIANGDEYKGWLRNFRAENKLSFQRSFLFTLLAVIALNALFPLFALSAEISLARGDPPIMTQVMEDATADDYQNSNGTMDSCLPEASFTIVLYISGKIKVISETAKCIERSKKIDQVPISGLFGCEILISS